MTLLCEKIECLKSQEAQWCKESSLNRMKRLKFLRPWVFIEVKVCESFIYILLDICVDA